MNNKRKFYGYLVFNSQKQRMLPDLSSALSYIRYETSWITVFDEEKQSQNSTSTITLLILSLPDDYSQSNYVTVNPLGKANTAAGRIQYPAKDHKIVNFSKDANRSRSATAGKSLQNGSSVHRQYSQTSATSAEPCPGKRRLENSSKCIGECPSGSDFTVLGDSTCYAVCPATAPFYDHGTKICKKD